MSEWLQAEPLYLFRDTTGALLVLFLSYSTVLHPHCPLPLNRKALCPHFDLAKALQTVSLGSLPLSPESISCWAASTKQWSHFLLSLPCSLCPGENIKCLHKVYAKIFMNIFRRFFWLSPLCLKIEQEETNRRTSHTTVWREIHSKQLDAIDHFALG